MDTQTFVSGRFRVRERRSRGLVGRVARLTWPVRMRAKALSANLGDVPCQILGHKWVEIPELLRRSATGDGKRMRLKCSRCFLCNLT